MTEEIKDMEEKEIEEEMRQKEECMQKEKWYQVSLENAQLQQKIGQLNRQICEHSEREENLLDELAKEKKKLKEMVSSIHMLEFQEATNALRLEHAEALRTGRPAAYQTLSANQTFAPAHGYANSAQVPKTRGANLTSFDIDGTLEAGKTFVAGLINNIRG